jgi:hypothetical protein
MKTEEQENKKNLSSERMKTTFAAFALGVNKILLSWLRHYKKGQEMLRQTLMTTNKNIVHSSGVIILSYKNEFRGKLFFYELTMKRHTALPYALLRSNHLCTPI